MTLRTKLSLILSALLSLSIGMTGGVLIYESATTLQREVRADQQLLAENRAFSLRDNLEILEGELQRLSLLPQVDPNDRNSEPEARLLEHTHAHSVLYNTAVLLLDHDGTCVGAVPDRSDFRGRAFGELAWFRQMAGAGDRPTFRVSDDPVIGRTLKIAQPILRNDRFSGAIVGVIAVDQSNLLVSAITDTLPDHTDAMLVDSEGRVIFPTEWHDMPAQSGWGKAIAMALQGKPGTLSASVGDEQSLFAFAPVGASSNYHVLFRRPWSELVSHLRRQVMALLGVLLFGMGVAGAGGLWLSAYVTRPLNLLRESAGRITRGQRRPSLALRFSVSGDELGELVEDFLEMEHAIMQRDQELRDAALLLERRVKERTAQLEAAQKALLDAERFAAMGKTSAAIAHELKNTLNGLGMAVELILEDPANKSRVERLKTQVLSEIGRLRDVVDSLLSFSRPPRIELRAENLGEVVKRALALLGDLVEERGVELTTELPLHVEVMCDGRKVQGVVLNLVKNAIEAATHVHLRMDADAEIATIAVSDDGPGFSPEAQGHMFEPFFTTKRNGVGLGLATSLRYIEAHGGEMTVGRCAALGGALASVRLPRRSAVERNPTTSATAPERGSDCTTRSGP